MVADIGDVNVSGGIALSEDMDKEIANVLSNTGLNKRMLFPRTTGK